MAVSGEWLTVKNWTLFQHYKQRNPRWIKLHQSVLDDYEFAKLPDTTKAHLVLIWIFASQHAGKVPDDPSYLRRRLMLHSEPDLETLINQGFLVRNASTMLAGCKQSAGTEKSRIDKSRVERSKPVDKSIGALLNKLAFLYKKPTDL